MRALALIIFILCSCSIFPQTKDGGLTEKEFRDNCRKYGTGESTREEDLIYFCTHSPLEWAIPDPPTVLQQLAHPTPYKDVSKKTNAGNYMVAGKEDMWPQEVVTTTCKKENKNSKTSYCTKKAYTPQGWGNVNNS
jgi:hypothetical protein